MEVKLLASTEERLKAVQEHNTSLAKSDAPAATMSSESLRANIALDLEGKVKELEAMRNGLNGEAPLDLTFAEFAKEVWGFAPSDNGAPDSLMEACGINPSNATIHKLLAMPDFNGGLRWLVPEVFREAIRLGMRKAPIYQSLIIANQNVSQPTVIMPHIEMSDAMPTKINEGETIPTGMTKYGQKTVKLQKLATGIEVTDEVLQYVNLNVIALYLQDMGVKLGIGLDVLALQTLINGDQLDGSEAAPVIGVGTANSLAYIDFLRVWLRGAQLGRNYAGFIASEQVALPILNLAEFKALAGTGTLVDLKMQTPVPRSQNAWIHGYMPANKLMFVDPSGAMLQLTSAALRVDSDRIVNRQINGSFASLTTGFANVYRDGRVIVDTSLSYTGNEFPAWMNPAIQQSEAFK
jgi:HK97 family phage major capsid protein